MVKDRGDCAHAKWVKWVVCSELWGLYCANLAAAVTVIRIQRVDLALDPLAHLLLLLLLPVTWLVLWPRQKKNKKRSILTPLSLPGIRFQSSSIKAYLLSSICKKDVSIMSCVDIRVQRVHTSISLYSSSVAETWSSTSIVAKSYNCYARLNQDIKSGINFRWN